MTAKTPCSESMPSAHHPCAYPDAHPSGGVAPTCTCEACMPQEFLKMRMILCAICGNKRCPHAANHRNACTGSNEPGQPGSSYPNSPRPTASAAETPTPRTETLVAMFEAGWLALGSSAPGAVKPLIDGLKILERESAALRTELERVTWELNTRRGSDKAREEDRLSAHAHAEAAESALSAARAGERERCAMVCLDDEPWDGAGEYYAARIRALSEEEQRDSLAQNGQFGAGV